MGQQIGEVSNDGPKRSNSATYRRLLAYRAVARPPREPDMWQRISLSSIDGTLLAYFADSDDTLICGDGYLLRNAGASVELVPDCVFADGVRDPQSIIRRNGYVISEVGKPPDFVLEVGSRGTGWRDYMAKRDGYAALGVLEYWRFEPSGGSYHDTPLEGDGLVDGEYVAIEVVRESETQHRGHSEALGLELWWDNKMLRFRHPATGTYLPPPEELGAARLAAESRVAELESALRRLPGE